MDMSALKTRLRRLALSNTGQDLLEYALLVALIALVAVGAVTQVGNTINNRVLGSYCCSQCLTRFH
jgi:Flp pilus assembly pilin Flp